MSDLRPLVGIDVGSSTVSVVVAVMEDDQLIIKGCGQARHDGAKKGVIANLEEVTSAVRVAAEEAEVMASVPVEEAVVGIGGTPITGNQVTASVPITGRNQTVSHDDQSRAWTACARREIPNDYRVFDLIPCGFTLDGQEGIEHPVGIPGNRLDASAYVLYTHKTHADTVEKSVNQAAIAVSRIFYEPLAAAEAVLSHDERDLGCLLLDLGYGTTEWVLFAEGVVADSGALPVGGRHFTSDLAVILKTTQEAAERVKKKIGAATDRYGLEGEAIEVPDLGRGGHQVHPAQFVTEILHERGRELFIGIHQALAAKGMEGLPRAGLVLTGGGARLDGMEELAEVIFGHRVRIGTPHGLAGLNEPVSGPEWSVACGLVRLHQRRQRHHPLMEQTGGGFLARLRSALGELFELGGGT